MKLLYIIFLIILCGTVARSQKIKYEDFKSLLLDLQSERYSSVFERSKKLLEHSRGDNGDLTSIVRYINMFCAAHMVLSNFFHLSSLTFHF